MYAKQKSMEYSPSGVHEPFNVGGNKRTYTYWNTPANKSAIATSR